jgi:hypothetical protein
LSPLLFYRALQRWVAILYFFDERIPGSFARPPAGNVTPQSPLFQLLLTLAAAFFWVVGLKWFTVHGQMKAHWWYLSKDDQPFLYWFYFVVQVIVIFYLALKAYEIALRLTVSAIEKL